MQAQIIRRHISLRVSGVSELPPELLREIFRWAVENETCLLARSIAKYPAFVLSHVCRQWRFVALASPIWNRISVALNVATYARAVSQTEVLFEREPRNNLRIEIYRTKHADYTPSMAVHDIVTRYSPRIVFLDLRLTTAAMEALFRLPAGTFAVLRTLRITVYHEVHSDWLLFGPDEDPTMTKMSQLAPLLSGFSFKIRYPTDEEYCDCITHPLRTGFDFGLLKYLHLCIDLPYPMAHQLLRLCMRLETCTLRLTDGGFRAGDTDLSVITLEALAVLFIITCSNWDAAEYFLQPLKLPALRKLMHRAHGNGAGYTYGGLVHLIQRSDFHLSTLHLFDVRPIGGHEFGRVLDLQCRLTELKISSCRGTFWKALLRPVTTCIPKLVLFHCIDFPMRHAQYLVGFIEARCPIQRSGTALKYVFLAPAFPLTNHGAPLPEGTTARMLKHALCDWRGQGIKVKVDRYKFPGHELDTDSESETHEETDDSEDSEWESEASSGCEGTSGLEDLPDSPTDSAS
ncbi:hypothetical protein B0H13DRAFT_732146 [Mycena leptocephala]|nr:hypothetical protein B0H13DRAFT_732146 [Mycena leptocephala]